MKIGALCGLCVGLNCGNLVAGNEAFLGKLNAAKTKIDEALKKIHDRWDIEHFPNFLRSASMSHTSWEVLKVCSFLHYFTFTFIFFKFCV